MLGEKGEGRDTSTCFTCTAKCTATNLLRDTLASRRRRGSSDACDDTDGGRFAKPVLEVESMNEEPDCGRPI